MRTIKATLGTYPTVSEQGETNVAGAIDDILALTPVETAVLIADVVAALQALPVDNGSIVLADAVAAVQGLTPEDPLIDQGDVTTAIQTISDQLGGSGVSVTIGESTEPSQAQVIDALGKIMAQIRASDLFTEIYYS